jgi:hypothetical protein
MNRWYDEDCKAFHRQIRHAFTHAHPSYPGLKVSYHRLLRRKKRLFISQRRYDLSISLTHSPKNFWHTILPHRSPLPSDLDPGSMFSHISTLYDIPIQAQIQVTSPPSSCYLFSDKDIREVVWVMNNSKAADEEGFQAEFFKHGLRALVSYLDDLFNHVVCTGFPSAWSHHIIHPIHKSSPSSIPTITGRSWWAIHSRSSMLQLSIGSSLVSLSVDTSELRDKQGFRHAHQTIDHIFTLRPSLRRHDIGLRKSIVAL